MRVLIRTLDAIQRRAIGVIEFCSDPTCVLRWQLTQAPHPLCLSGGKIGQGEPVLVLHLWNERLPTLPLEGSTLAWAVRFQHLLIQSFHEVARELCRNPRLADLRAVGGVLALLPIDDNSAGVRLIHRLGFTVLPYRNPLGRFGEFWENFYTWLLMWTYNPGSLSSHRLFHLRRREIWMTKDEFVNRYYSLRDR